MKNISELNRGGRDCWRILGTSVSCGKGYDSVRDRQKAKKKRTRRKCGKAAKDEVGRVDRLGIF